MINDEELKKKRNKERRQMEKDRLLKITSTMTEEERSKFKKERAQRRKEERERVKQAMATGQVMMIDLVFEDKMNGKENKSLAKQVELITKAIKHIDDPPSIHLCSFGGQAQTQLEKMGYQHWSITTHP